MQSLCHYGGRITEIRTRADLRLTDEGFRFISEEIELTTYDVPFPRDFELTVNTIIWMDNFIDCPYYLSPNRYYRYKRKKGYGVTTCLAETLRKYGLTKALNRNNKT